MSFAPLTEHLLARAEQLCASRDARLTALRRQVLGLVLDADRPVGAYDILDRLKRDHAAAVPPTVYRALDFLLAQGLVHRIERLSAFVACLHAIEHSDAHHVHQAGFLICRGCGTVTELDDARVVAALGEIASAIGFRLGHATVEADGLCAACLPAGATPTPPPPPPPSSTSTSTSTSTGAEPA